MERYEIIKKVRNDLCKLKEEEHVEDLMKAGRVDELSKIAKEIKFDEVNEFLSANLLNMIEEDYEGYCMELVFYICVSGFSEVDFVKDRERFISELSDTGNLGNIIADAMDCFYLNELSIKQLVGRY